MECVTQYVTQYVLQYVLQNCTIKQNLSTYMHKWWYRPRESDVNELIADGVLDEKFKDFTQNELVTFDIETQLMRTENQGM